MKGLSIVGGGYAGLTTAISLAKRGFKAVVFERAPFIGSGEAENFKAIRNYDLPTDFIDFLKGEGISIDFGVLKPIYKITKFAPAGKKMTVFSDDGPLFYSIRKSDDRDSLDFQLYENALNEGVEFKFSQNKSLISGDIISVNSVYRNAWAYGNLYKGVNVDENEILFFMDNRYAPNGYLYAIPHGKHEIAIAATTFDLNCPLPVLFNNFLVNNKVVSELIDDAFLADHFGGFAYANFPKTAEIQGKKFVGSAAGFVDAARGFGVRYAVQSGVLAARSFATGESYDALWQSSFGKDLLEGLRRRFLLEKMTNEDYDRLIMDNKISIKRYDKYPGPFKKLLLEFEFSNSLAEWQKKYDLAKLFG